MALRPEWEWEVYGWGMPLVFIALFVVYLKTWCGDGCAFLEMALAACIIALASYIWPAFLAIGLLAGIGYLIAELF